jgi:hypothetical protein
MNNLGEGRVWKIAEGFTLLLAVAVIVRPDSDCRFRLWPTQTGQ